MASPVLTSLGTRHGSFEDLNLATKREISSHTIPSRLGRRASVGSVELSPEQRSSGSSTSGDEFVSCDTKAENGAMFSTKKSPHRTNSFGKACDLEKSRTGAWNMSKKSKVAESPKSPPPLPNRSPTTRLTFVDDLDSAYYSSSSSGGDSVVSSVLEEPPPDYEVTYEELDTIRQDIYNKRPQPPPPSRNYPPHTAFQPMRITQVQGGGIPPKQPPVSKSSDVKRPVDTGHHYFSIRDTSLPPTPPEQMALMSAGTQQSASQPHVHVHLCQGECQSPGFPASQGHFHGNQYSNNSATRPLPPSGWQDAGAIPPPPGVTSMYRSSPESPTSPGTYQEIPAQTIGHLPPHAVTAGRSNSLGDVMATGRVNPSVIGSGPLSVHVQNQKATAFHSGPQVVNIESIPDMPQLGARAASPLPPPPNFPAPPPPISQGQTTPQRNAFNGSVGLNTAPREQLSPPLPPPPPELLEYNGGLGIYEDILGQREATEQLNIPPPPPAPPIPAPPPPPPLPTSAPQRKYSATNLNNSESQNESSSKPQQPKPAQHTLSFSAAEIGNALKTLKKTGSKVQKPAPNPEPDIEPAAQRTANTCHVTPPPAPAPLEPAFNKGTPQAPAAGTFKSPELEREKRSLRSSSSNRLQNRFGSTSDEASEQIPKIHTLKRTQTKTSTSSGVTNGNKVEDLSPARLRPTRSSQPDVKATLIDAPACNSLRNDLLTSKQNLTHANTAPGDLSSGYSSSMSESSESGMTEEHTVSPSAIAAKHGRGRSFVVKGKDDSPRSGNAFSSGKSSQGEITQHKVPTVNAPQSPRPFGASRILKDSSENGNNPLYAAAIKSFITTTSSAEKQGDDEDDSEKRKLSQAEILAAQRNFSQRDGKYQDSYTGTSHAAALTSRITSGLARTTLEGDKTDSSSPPKGLPAMSKATSKVLLPNSPLLSALYLTSVIKSKQTEHDTNTTTTAPSASQAGMSHPPSVTSAANQKGDIFLSPKNIKDFEQLIATNQDNTQSKMEGIDVTKIPGYIQIPANTPAWKKQVMEKKNAEILKKYQSQYEEILKEQRAAEVAKLQEQEQRRLEEEKWKGIPEWKRKIMRDKQKPAGAAAQAPPAAKQPAPAPAQKKGPQKAPPPAQQKAPQPAPKQKQAQPPPQPQPAQPAQKKLDVKQADPLPPEKPAQTPADIPRKVSTASITFKQNPAGAQDAIPVKRSIKVLKRSKA